MEHFFLSMGATANVTSSRCSGESSARVLPVAYIIISMGCDIDGEDGRRGGLDRSRTGSARAKTDRHSTDVRPPSTGTVRQIDRSGDRSLGCGRRGRSDEISPAKTIPHGSPSVRGDGGPRARHTNIIVIILLFYFSIKARSLYSMTQHHYNHENITRINEIVK